MNSSVHAPTQRMGLDKRLAAALLVTAGSGAGLSSVPSTPLPPPPSPPNGLALHVAPMQCYTNRHFRYACRQLSESAVLWTEMEKVDDLLARPEVLLRHDNVGLNGGGFGGRGEHHGGLHGGARAGGLVLQLGGNDPKLLADAARICTEHGGYDEINLNLGCPSITTGGNDCFGAALMRDPARVRELVEAMAEATHLPISLKCRVGVHERLLADGSVPPDDYRVLSQFVEETSRTGAVRGGYHIHARAAILAGLSPVQNRRAPALRHEFVHRLSAEFAHLDVTINGGINSMHDVRDMAIARLGEGPATRKAAALGPGPKSGEGLARGGIVGAMAGRWFLRAPLDLRLVDGDGISDTGNGRVCASDGIRAYGRCVRFII